MWASVGVRGRPWASVGVIDSGGYLICTALYTPATTQNDTQLPSGQWGRSRLRGPLASGVAFVLAPLWPMAW